MTDSASDRGRQLRLVRAREILADATTGEIDDVRRVTVDGNKYELIYHDDLVDLFFDRRFKSAANYLVEIGGCFNCDTGRPSYVSAAAKSRHRGKVHLLHNQSTGDYWTVLFDYAAHSYGVAFRSQPEMLGDQLMLPRASVGFSAWGAIISEVVYSVTRDTVTLDSPPELLDIMFNNRVELPESDLSAETGRALRRLSELRQEATDESRLLQLVSKQHNAITRYSALSARLSSYVAEREPGWLEFQYAISTRTTNRVLALQRMSGVFVGEDAPELQAAIRFFDMIERESQNACVES